MWLSELWHGKNANVEFQNFPLLEIFVYIIDDVHLKTSNIALFKLFKTIY